jgi:hypothetical protein
LQVGHDAQVNPVAVFRFHYTDGVALQEIRVMGDVVMRGIESEYNPKIVRFVIMIGKV